MTTLQTDAIFLGPLILCPYTGCVAHYGICGHTLTWIKELLTGISQQVVVNGKYSDLVEVISEVLYHRALYWGHCCLSTIYILYI